MSFDKSHGVQDVSSNFLYFSPYPFSSGVFKLNSHRNILLVSFPSDIIPIFCILCIADLFIAITELFSFNILRLKSVYIVFSVIKDSDFFTLFVFIFNCRDLSNLPLFLSSLSGESNLVVDLFREMETDSIFLC